MNDLKATKGDTFRRITEWNPAYNRVAEGYGRHGMDLRFVLVGPRGAVHLLIYTNWYTSRDRIDNERGGVYCPDGRRRVDTSAPMPADLGYHSPEQRHEHQWRRDECGYLNGPCYSDGSGLNAQDVFDVLTDEGEEAMWRVLEQYYEATFNDGEFPAVIGRRWNSEHSNA